MYNDFTACRREVQKSGTSLLTLQPQAEGQIASMLQQQKVMGSSSIMVSGMSFRLDRLTIGIY